MTQAAELGTDIRILSGRQAMFIGYTLAVLVDLVVLNLFNQFWSKVQIDTFATSLLVAILLQVLLKLTLALEHRMADLMKRRGGRYATAKRVLVTWLILFGSKFVILGVINFVFGDSVLFGGVIPFIVVVVAVMLAELVVSRIYAMLGTEEATGKPQQA